MRVLASTKDMSREKWLELRKRSIGGSEAAVILGLNQYCSPYTLWAEKKGLLDQRQDNEAMRIGRDLENYVAIRFKEATGKKVRRRNAMFLHDKYDFISANIDREVVGEKAGLECKTTSTLNLHKFKDGEFPANYYIQCMHYMAVMGYEKMYLAVLVLGKAFYWFEIPRNEKEINSLISAEKEWWEKYISGDNIPEVDGTENTGDTINSIYPQSEGYEVSNTGLKEAAENYIQLKSRIKELEKSLSEYEQEIKAFMGEAEVCSMGSFEAVWKNQKRAGIDSKKLKEERPEIYNKYLKTTVSRRFTLKELK